MAACYAFRKSKVPARCRCRKRGSPDIKPTSQGRVSGGKTGFAQVASLPAATSFFHAGYFLKEATTSELTINLPQPLQKRSLEWPDERLKIVIRLESQNLKGDTFLPVPLVDTDSLLDNPPFDQKRGVVNDPYVYGRDGGGLIHLPLYGQFQLESFVGWQRFGQHQRDVHIAGGEDSPPGDGAIDIRRDDGVAGENGGEDLLHPGQDGLRLLLSLETDIVNHQSTKEG